MFLMLFFENIVLQMYLTLTIHFTDKTYICFVSGYTLSLQNRLVHIKKLLVINITLFPSL